MILFLKLKFHYSYKRLIMVFKKKNITIWLSKSVPTCHLNSTAIDRNASHSPPTCDPSCTSSLNANVCHIVTVRMRVWAMRIVRCNVFNTQRVRPNKTRHADSTSQHGMWWSAEKDGTEFYLSLNRVWCTWSEVGRRRTLCNKTFNTLSCSATSSESRKPRQSSTRGVP